MPTETVSRERVVQRGGVTVRVRTTIRTTTLPAGPPTKQRLADRTLCDRFTIEHGHAPQPGDGAAWDAAERLTKGNLRKERDMPALPGEPPHSVRWRQRAAERELRALVLKRAGVASARPPVRAVAPVTRDRESRTPSSRREGARAGVARDGPDPEPGDDPDPAVASRPRAGVAAWRAQVRRAPQLVVRVPLEGRAETRIEAGTFEDEQRLRLWLGRSPHTLVQVACGLLELQNALLDERDESEAA
jgi:hypothetical protein